MDLLITNIKELLQVRAANTTVVSGKNMAELPTIKNAFLVVHSGKIINFGPMANCPNTTFTKTIDASGKMLLPTWCDSHTHIVYAGNREQEFVDRIKGLSYADIAAKGGGILNSAKQLQNTPENDLYSQSKARLDAVIKLGTGAIEIKSGYGLTEAAELKMLRVIKRLKTDYNLPIKATFLGAHALPENYINNKKGYLELLINSILPKVAKDNLADFIDVFCEDGYFTTEDTAKLLAAGKRYNLQGKIHVNQFNALGGIGVGVKHNARSVDHLEVLTAADIAALKNTNTIPVALPTCSFFLGLPYTPARQLINANLPLAIASDFNPGSTPSGNMNFVVSTACIKLKLTPEEAINAATINGAYAMGLEHKVGSITKGKLANFIITTPLNSYNMLPYAFGNTQIDSVFIKGKKVN